MTSEKNEKRNLLKFNAYFDYTLFFMTIFLVCFGLVMIYSSSSYVAQRSASYNNDSAFFLNKQLKNAILGVALMLMVAKCNYKWVKAKIFNIPIIYYLYFGTLVLQIYVLFKGEKINGKRRWIKIAGITFQPSDITKLVLILLIAYMLYKAPRKLDSMMGFLAVVVITGPVIIFIALANLSTAIVTAAIVGGMCLVESRRKWYYGFFAGMFAVMTYIFIVYFSDAYRSERIQIWLNIDTHEKGFQIRQGLYAIASGGLTGTGLGDSLQKLGYIPEAQNDMIFTVICEELGILGAIVVLFMFAMLLYRIYIIAINAPDLMGSMICVGVMIQVAVQVIINVAVVTNSIPSTGIALPFISYGGTSLIIMMIEIGAVLCVSNQIRHGK